MARSPGKEYVMTPATRQHGRCCGPRRRPSPDGGRTVLREAWRALFQKFGGTSVADVEPVKNVARRVKCEVDTGNGWPSSSRDGREDEPADRLDA